MDDIRPDAIKIGMVNDAATIRTIADVLAEYKPRHLVVDPVMVSTSGSQLMEETAVLLRTLATNGFVAHSEHPGG